MPTIASFNIDPAVLMLGEKDAALLKACREEMRAPSE